VVRKNTKKAGGAIIGTFLTPKKLEVVGLKSDWLSGKNRENLRKNQEASRTHTVFESEIEEL